MTVRYKYDSLDEFIEDRALPTHMAIRDIRHSDVQLGQIIRNVMKHAFKCGIVYAGGQIEKGDWE